MVVIDYFNAMMEIEYRDSRELWLHQLRVCIMGYKNLTIINDQNPKKNWDLPTTYYSYYIVHLSKNLISDVWDKEAVKLFRVVAGSVQV